MRDDPILIASVQEVVQRLHKCQAVHCETVPVDETSHGKTRWRGNVEIFELKGHPKAKRCFAWLHEEGKTKRYMALLESRAVASPESAVLAVFAFCIPNTDSDHPANFGMS